MKDLIGKEILGFLFNEGEYDLTLVLQDSNRNYSAYGDCCSESWFEVNEDLMTFPATILDVEEIQLSDVDATRQEYETVFGFKLKTTNGYLDIILRNSSNGYYGGSIVDQLTQNSY